MKPKPMFLISRGGEPLSIITSDQINATEAMAIAQAQAAALGLPDNGGPLKADDLVLIGQGEAAKLAVKGDGNG